MAILKPIALQRTLNEVNTGGVYAVILLNQSGSPIAQSILNNESPTASIAAHIWKMISKSGDSFKAGEIDNFVIECDEGKVIVGSVLDYVLCIYAKEHVQSGLLFTKFDVLRDYLRGPLSKVSS